MSVRVADVRPLDPLKTAVKEFLKENDWTPDLYDLQKHYRAIPVFLYGNEKQGFSDHFRMSRSTLLGYGYADKNFIMCKHHQYDEPVVFCRPNAPTAARVIGELYLCPIQTVIDLDLLYENGFYNRRVCRVVSYYAKEHHDGKRTTVTTTAWMYQGVPEEYDSLIKKGALPLHPLFHPGTAHRFQPGAPFYEWRLSDDKPNRDMYDKRIAQFDAAKERAKR